MSDDRASVPTCHTTAAAGAVRTSSMMLQLSGVCPATAQISRLPGARTLEAATAPIPTARWIKSRPQPATFASYSSSSRFSDNQVSPQLSTDTNELQPKAQQRATTQLPKSETHQTSAISPPSGTKLTHPKPSPPRENTHKRRPSMSFNQPTPPLLLTKRLTTFLSANLNAHLHTALLATPSGRLLAHASPHPVALLRTQSTVASSLFALHGSTAPDIPDALPTSHSSPSAASSPPMEKPLTITVQLAAGVVVIRRLKCGLLFVCIGPLAEHIEEGSGSGGQLQQGGLAAHGGYNGTGERSGGATPSQMPASPSEVDSVLSVGGITTASLGSVGSVNTAGVVVMRRHAEELARWLDDKLGSLRVPEEGVGVE